MRTKRIAASLLLLLSTSAYAIETSHISGECIEGFYQRAGTRDAYAKVASPLHRIVNSNVAANLRFLPTKKQWNPELSGHFQSIVTSESPVDAMTQFVHFLFPSPAGNYLVANQSSDIIAATDMLKFYNALSRMRQGETFDVWGLFTLLFDRELSPFAQKIIESERINFCIEQCANALIKAYPHQIPTEIIDAQKEKDFFEDGFLESGGGKLFKQALKGGNPAWQNIRGILPKRIKNLKDTIDSPKVKSKKKNKLEKN